MIAGSGHPARAFNLSVRIFRTSNDTPVPVRGTGLLMLSAVALLAVWRKSRKGEPAAAAC